MNPSKLSTFPLHLHNRKIISVLCVTNSSQLHLILLFIWESTQVKNLIHALTVVKKLLSNMTWRGTCVLTLVNIPSLVPYVHTLVHTNTVSSNTCARTQGRSHSPVMCARSRSLKAVIWNDTKWLIQGRNHSPVMCVGSPSQIAVIWNNMNWLTQGRSLTSVSIVGNHLVGRVT